MTNPTKVAAASETPTKCLECGGSGQVTNEFYPCMDTCYVCKVNNNLMSDTKTITPETDCFIYATDGKATIGQASNFVEHARKLERQRDEARRELEWLWQNCRIVYYYPTDALAYPLEHMAMCNKNSRSLIEAQMRSTKPTSTETNSADDFKPTRDPYDAGGSSEPEYPGE